MLFIIKWFLRSLFSAAQKVKKVQYWILETKESFKGVDVFKNSFYLCTKCHICYVGCPLTALLLLFTKTYHHFKNTWSFSFSVNMHLQNMLTQEFQLR